MLMHGILGSQVSSRAWNNILALKMEYEQIAVMGHIGCLTVNGLTETFEKNYLSKSIFLFIYI